MKDIPRMMKYVYPVYIHDADEQRSGIPKVAFQINGSAFRGKPRLPLGDWLIPRLTSVDDINILAIFVFRGFRLRLRKFTISSLKYIGYR